MILQKPVDASGLIFILWRFYHIGMSGTLSLNKTD